MSLKNEIKVQDHVADYYVEKRYKGLGLKYHSTIIKEMMEDVNGKILDVGTGTGILHDLYPSLDIIGIDVSEGMLRFNKGKCMVASAETVPFPDNHFDIVFCRSVLHHLPKCEVALKELKRVLRPGGKFICWETNKSKIATIVRRFTQHGDHFSEYHTSFNNLPSIIGNFFSIKMVKYQGFLAYPLYGFPDILDFSSIFRPFFQIFMFIDKVISRIPMVNRLSFAVMIKAIK